MGALCVAVFVFLCCAAARPRDAYKAIVEGSLPIYQLFANNPVYMLGVFKSAAFASLQKRVKAREDAEIAQAASSLPPGQMGPCMRFVQEAFIPPLNQMSKMIGQGFADVGARLADVGARLDSIENRIGGLETRFQVSSSLRNSKE
jgi:hypothetical protein